MKISPITETPTEDLGSHVLILDTLITTGGLPLTCACVRLKLNFNNWKVSKPTARNEGEYLLYNRREDHQHSSRPAGPLPFIILSSWNINNI